MEEHLRFLKALKIYGKEWRKVQQLVGSRTSTQARSHAQKFFVKLERKNLTLDEFLSNLDVEHLEKSYKEKNHAHNSSSQGGAQSASMPQRNQEDDFEAHENELIGRIASAKKRASVMNIALPEKIGTESSNGNDQKDSPQSQIIES